VEASPQILAYDALRAALLRRPEPAVWLPPMRAYHDLALELETRWSPNWWVPFGDDSAFEAARADAARGGEVLRSAIDQLEQLPDNGAGWTLAADWIADVLRAMQSVALVAAAWDEGAATMERALDLLPEDLAQSAKDLAGRAAGWLDTWGLPLLLGTLGLGAVVGGVIVARKVAR